MAKYSFTKEDADSEIISTDDMMKLLKEQNNTIQLLKDQLFNQQKQINDLIKQMNLIQLQEKDNDNDNDKKQDEQKSESADLQDQDNDTQII